MTNSAEAPRSGAHGDRAPADMEPQEAKRERFRPSSFVTPRVMQLQKDYLNGSSTARAVLAQLRRATDAEPGTAWEIGSYLIPELDLNDDPYSTDVWNERTAEASYTETAIHIAMTSYAWLQQSSKDEMHVSKRSLGEAARILAQHPDEPMDRDKVWGRLAKLAQAESVTGMRWQLRGVIGLLRRRQIGLDVGLLADDLLFWQIRSQRQRVQRAWSRAFFGSRKHSDQAASPTDGSAGGSEDTPAGA